MIKFFWFLKFYFGWVILIFILVVLRVVMILVLFVFLGEFINDIISFSLIEIEKY